MAFEVFARRTRPRNDVAIITIQSRGSMSLNKSAYALLVERRPKGASGDLYVELLFDPDRRIVAFKPTAKTATNGYIVRKQPNAATYILTGKGFVQYWGILGAKLVRYRAHPIEDNLVGFSVDTDVLGGEQEDDAKQAD